MAIKATETEILHQYAIGVMERVEHHAGNVGGVALTLLGGVIWRAAPGSICIKEYAGKLANVLWWTSYFTGKKYALSYNHETYEIEIREQTIKGVVLHSLSNKKSLIEVLEILNVL